MVESRMSKKGQKGMEMAQQERVLAVKFDPQVKYGSREPTAVGS